jgi:hypothetical protein
VGPYCGSIVEVHSEGPWWGSIVGSIVGFHSRWGIEEVHIRGPYSLKLFGAILWVQNGGHIGGPY